MTVQAGFLQNRPDLGAKIVGRREGGDREKPDRAAKEPTAPQGRSDGRGAHGMRVKGTPTPDKGKGS